MSALAGLRPGFLARSRREKILTVVFLVAFALAWAFTFVGRAKTFSLRLGVARAEAASQAVWLDNREAIEARYGEVLSRLTDAKLPSSSEVLAQVDALMRKYGFARFRIDRLPTQQREGLLFHTISISIDNADYGQLQTFQNELMVSLPTVNLEQITLAADRRNPAQLNASLRLVAIETNR